MKLWQARAEFLAGHLLWRVSWGLLPGRRAAGKVEAAPVMQEEIPVNTVSVAATDETRVRSAFANRLAELQQAGGFDDHDATDSVVVETKPPPARRELSTGKFILLVLLVLTLIVASFFF